MKNQNSISRPTAIIKPPPSVSLKQKNKIMDNETKQQQIDEENTTSNFDETVTIDRPSIQLNEKVMV